jgi:uncharacterized protein YuzE
MRIIVDEPNDTLYFRLDESPVMESEEIKKWIILDFNADGQVVGIEIVGIKKFIPREQLKKLRFETV